MIEYITESRLSSQAYFYWVKYQEMDIFRKYQSVDELLPSEVPELVKRQQHEPVHDPYEGIS